MILIQNLIIDVILILFSRSCSAVTPPYIEEQNTSIYTQYPLIVENREQLQQQFKQAGILTAMHYPVPLNKQPALKTNEYDSAIEDSLSEKMISLPMRPYLRMQDQQVVVEILIKA